jgi:Ca2+-binding EF-hand superfamily protein
MRKLFLATALIGSLGMMAPPAVAQDASKGSGQGADVFERMDQNGDGKISKDEARANAMSRFGEIDANGDGKVTDADINARVDAMKEENPDVPDRRFKRQKQVLKAQFKRLDENGDGELSSDEYAKSALSRHDNLDQNGDGVVTKQEIKKVRQQMRKQIKQQRQKQKQKQGGNQ